MSILISSGAKSVSEIRNECRHQEFDCIIIDYLQLVKADVRYQSRASEVGAVSKAIKVLAMELNVPIIALSQLNRVSEVRETKEPTMGELREAGNIEQDASIIILSGSSAECGSARITVGQCACHSTQGMGEDISVRDTVSSGEDMEDEAVREIDKERMKRELWLAVDQLPGDQPAVLRMVCKEGVTRIKAGEVLGYGNGKVGIEEQRALNALRKPHRCRKFRAYFEEYLSAVPIHHVGVRRFNETWTSEVEREAFRWAEKELGYS